MIFTRHTVPNALRALCRFVRAVFSKDPALADPRVQLARTLRCHACPFYLEAYDQCGVCTCVVALKTTLASEQCPASTPRWRRQTRFSEGL